MRRGVGGADSTVRRCRRVAHHRGQLRGSSPLGSFIRRNPMLADGLRLGLIATLNPDSQFDKANRGPYNGPAILAHDARRLAEATSRLRWRNGAPNASGLRPRAWPCYAARSPTLGRMTTTPRDRTPGKAWRVQTSSLKWQIIALRRCNGQRSAAQDRIGRNSESGKDASTWHTDSPRHTRPPSAAAHGCTATGASYAASSRACRISRPSIGRTSLRPRVNTATVSPSPVTNSTS